MEVMAMEGGSTNNAVIYVDEPIFYCVLINVFCFTFRKFILYFDGKMVLMISFNAVRKCQNSLVVSSRSQASLSRISTKFYSSSNGSNDRDVVSIGSVSKKLSVPKNPEFVPKTYLPKNLPKETLQDLKWMLQKDLLGQDIFLLGRPGPGRRTLAQQYLEMTRREMEYVSLSRDTTESDLKQRREILGGTAFYCDQSAVQAATQGRVLVLDGIEKVERNVLPVLNNLLENREMHLEDGRLLIPAVRYDSLLEEHGQEKMDLWRLVRVSEDFRVIALGLPVPRYVGSPLDPPLRSRFQARDVKHLSYGQQLELLMNQGPNIDKETLASLLSFSHTLVTEESAGLGLLDFPIENLPNLVKLLNSVPDLSPYEAITKLYPYKLFLPHDGQKSVEDTLQTFNISPGRSSQQVTVDSVTRTSGQDLVQVGVKVGRRTHQLMMTGGTESGEVGANTGYVSTPYHDTLLSHLILSHGAGAGGMCLVGARGCGKTALVRQMSGLLGYKTETIQMYADMTARDLLQQRTTTDTGDTVWRLSPLMEAALEGKMAVLDGLHRVHRGTLAVLQRLIHDREVQLYDGTRLVDQSKFDLIREENGWTVEDMSSRGVLPIHPAFRLVALAEPPTIGQAKGQWMTAEILSMFVFHDMRPLSQSEETQVVTSVAGGQCGQTMADIMTVTHKLRSSEDASLRSVATNLSTRQLLRLARRLNMYPDESAYTLINKACLGRFLPALAKETLEKMLEKLGVEKSISTLDENIKCNVHGGTLTIGNTSASVFNPETRGKVPETLFYDTPQNLTLMESMLQDFLLGEHMLLVGNQGTGKNKLVDRMLNLLNKPREYIQLNRDTTVQTLTLQVGMKI